MSNEHQTEVKAGVLQEYRKFLWQDVPALKIKADEVLIKTSYASICGCDSIFFRKSYIPELTYP